MTWSIRSPEAQELLREAARRGSLRQREIAEHARVQYGTGPKARFHIGTRHETKTLYFEGVKDAHRVEQQEQRYLSRRARGR